MSKLQEYIEKYKGIYSGAQKLILTKGKPNPNEGYGDGLEFVKKVYPFVSYTAKRKKRAISILDYGCGTAMHVHNPTYNIGNKYNNQTIFTTMNGMIQCYYCYDPAVGRYSTKPSPGSLFDLVAIPDVLEHVPEEHVDEVIQDSSSFVKEDGLYVITVSNNPAYAHFSNEDGSLGENLHCTLKPLEWWIEKIHSLVKDRAFVIVHNDSAYMKSIGSNATLRFYKHDSAYYQIDKSKFPYMWVDK